MSAYAEHSQPHNLTAEELALIGRVRDAYRITDCRCPVPLAGIACPVPTMWIFPVSSSFTMKQ